VEIRTRPPDGKRSRWQKHRGVGKAAGSDKLPGERRCNFLVGCSQPTLNQRRFSMVPAGAAAFAEKRALCARAHFPDISNEESN
jgi:hypothetical protein